MKPQPGSFERQLTVHEEIIPSHNNANGTKVTLTDINNIAAEVLNKIKNNQASFRFSYG